MTDKQVDKSLESLNIAAQTRALEIGLFWQRSLFYWGFIIAAGAGYVQTYRSTPSLGTVLACFGIVCSLSWSLVNRGSKYWQENWEIKAEAAAERALGGPLFGNPEPIHRPEWLGAKRFSVTFLTAGLSDFVCVGWVAATAYQLFSIARAANFKLTITLGLNIGFVGFTLLYGGCLFWAASRFRVAEIARYPTREQAAAATEALRTMKIAAQYQQIKRSWIARLFGQKDYFVLHVSANHLEKARKIVSPTGNDALRQIPAEASVVLIPTDTGRRKRRKNKRERAK
jgi:hypothetical protein